MLANAPTIAFHQTRMKGDESVATGMGHHTVQEGGTVIALRNNVVTPMAPSSSWNRIFGSHPEELGSNPNGATKRSCIDASDAERCGPGLSEWNPIGKFNLMGAGNCIGEPLSETTPRKPARESVEAIRSPAEMPKTWSSQQARKGGHGDVMLDVIR